MIIKAYPPGTRIKVLDGPTAIINWIGTNGFSVRYDCTYLNDHNEPKHEIYEAHSIEPLVAVPDAAMVIITQPDAAP